MMGRVKFRKATSPAFRVGELWVGASGLAVSIVGVRKYPGAAADDDHCSAYGVTYSWEDSSGKVFQHEKDCWNFQVRYTHKTDLV